VRLSANKAAFNTYHSRRQSFAIPGCQALRGAIFSYL
jgi:hypothetical protein